MTTTTTLGNRSSGQPGSLPNSRECCAWRDLKSLQDVFNDGNDPQALAAARCRFIVPSLSFLIPGDLRHNERRVSLGLYTSAVADDDDDDDFWPASIAV